MTPSVRHRAIEVHYYYYYYYIVIGCVDNNAFNGRYNENPYNSEHYDLRQLEVDLDGRQHSMIPVEPNFGANQYIEAYANLFAGTGKLMKDEGTDIRREDFLSRYALYAFDLTADLAEEGHFNLMKHGNVRLGSKFGTALHSTINVIAYAEFESVLEIGLQMSARFVSILLCRGLHTAVCHSWSAAPAIDWQIGTACSENTNGDIWPANFHGGRPGVLEFSAPCSKRTDSLV